MKMEKFCYWSVADGDHATMIAATVHSARKVEVQENFHIYSDKVVPGAITHEAGEFNKDHYLFKIDFLKDRVKELMYEYFVFIDADSWFVRNPGDIISYCGDDPIHIAMESDCTNLDSQRKDWWDCPLEKYCSMMREKGVRSNQIYNMNAGLWIVHRNAIDHVHRLGYEFWNFAKDQGFTFTEEAALAYAGHMLMADPYSHQLKFSPELWASDWMGHFEGKIPKDESWIFHDYMTHDSIPVQPAIVHAMRSKEQLKNYGTSLTS